MKQLETERILLRPWEATDAAQFYENCKNPKVGPMAGWKPHTSLEESRQVLDIFIEKNDTWAVVLKDGNRLIGSVGLHEDSMRAGVTGCLMLGYVLSEQFWGRGLMYELCREVIRFAFEEKNAKLLSVRHFSFNEQSKRVIQKCGFHLEGTLRQCFERAYDGKVFDSVCYSMTAKEFLANRRVNHSGDSLRDIRYAVVRMGRSSATTFLEWQYKPPFQQYSCPENAFDRTLAAILKGTDGTEYFAVYDTAGHFFGVYQYSFTPENKLQIEFRIRPELTGKGYGKSFVEECIRFGREQYAYGGDIAVKIIAENLPALELLQGMGFVARARPTELVYGVPTKYLYMEKAAPETPVER